MAAHESASEAVQQAPDLLVAAKKAAAEAAKELVAGRNFLVLVVGPSGAGKTLVVEELREHWGFPESPSLECDPTLALVSHPLFKTPENAIESLGSGGGRSVASSLACLFLLELLLC